MPTWDAKHYVEHHGNDRPFITVAKGGQLVPEAKAVTATIAELNGKTRSSRGNLVLATGHNSPEEVLLMVKEARGLGLQVLVTHPLLYSVGMNLEQMQQAVKMSAYLEFVSLFTSSEAMTKEYVEALRKIGPQYCIVSSDKGQGRGDEGHDGPSQSPVEGLSEAAQVLRKHGFDDAELTLLFRTNPAKILGLPPQLKGVCGQDSACSGPVPVARTIR